MPSSSTEKDILERIGKHFQVEYDGMEIDGRRLEMLQITNMPEHLNRLIAGHAIQQPLRDLPLWAKSWPGAIVLGRFLRKYSPAGKKLLEIGAGMGALSLVAAGYGFASIEATDMNQTAVDFITCNILRNNLQHVIKPRVLDITRDPFDASASFDMIAASEILYLDELHRPLLKFLGRHLDKNGKAFFCTDRNRIKPAFAKLARKTFDVEEGHIGLKADDGERHVFNILILSQK